LEGLDGELQSLSKTSIQLSQVIFYRHEKVS
jgi:hypothetical protein